MLVWCWNAPSVRNSHDTPLLHKTVLRCRVRQICLGRETCLGIIESVLVRQFPGFGLSGDRDNKRLRCFPHSGFCSCLFVYQSRVVLSSLVSSSPHSFTHDLVQSQ